MGLQFYPKLKDRSQRPLNETAVVRDARTVHHARIERSRIHQDGLLSSISSEEMAPPIGVGILVQRHLGEFARFDFRVQ